MEEEVANSPKHNVIGTVRADDARGATLIGVQIGPDRTQIREDLKRVLEESLQDLLVQHHLIQNFPHHDNVADSLYACEAQERSSIGFAVNNSGLVICPSAVGDVYQIRQLTSGTRSQPERIAQFSMLQALRIPCQTRGLIPAYREPTLGEQLYAFDPTGLRSALTVTMSFMWISIRVGTGFKTVTGAFGAIAENALGGGPIFNYSDEVVGIGVGFFAESKVVVVQPWSSIEKCIRMDWEVFPPMPTSTV